MLESAEYVRYLSKDYGFADFSSSNLRRVLYDYQLPDGRDIIIKEEFKQVSNKWEIAIGRMYFTMGLEMIWKYMLECLSEPMTEIEWRQNVLHSSKFSCGLNDKLVEILDKCNFDFETRERMVQETKRTALFSSSVENGLRIMLSVYNRFIDRSDIGDEKAFFQYGLDNQSIALVEFFDLVSRFKEKSIEVFLCSIMTDYLIRQHLMTAEAKLFQGRDGFYIERIDGRYYRKHEFALDFQGIRMKQLAQVMKDLDML